MFMLVISMLWLDFLSLQQVKILLFRLHKTRHFPTIPFQFSLVDKRRYQPFQPANNSSPFRRLQSCCFDHCVLMCLFLVAFKKKNMFPMHHCVKTFFKVWRSKKRRQIEKFFLQEWKSAGALGQLFVYSSHIGSYFWCFCCAIKLSRVNFARGYKL